MQSTATNLKEYLENDWRQQTLLPKLTETVKYKMLGYKNKQGFVFHLNVQKQNVSLYVGDIQKIDADKQLLTGIDTSKGCLRFRKTLKVADTKIVDRYDYKTIV